MGPIEFFCEKAMAWCERNGRVLEITGSEKDKDDVYLIRYYLIKSRWCNVFLHQFLRSDRDDLHDHPWDFVTYLVRGAYTENKFNQKTGVAERTRRTNCIYDDYMIKTRLRQNTLVFRRATDQHQVVVDQDLKRVDKDKAALTLFISGPTKREWGFWRKSLAGRTWIPWREYLGLAPDAPGRG